MVINEKTQYGVRFLNKDIFFQEEILKSIGAEKFGTIFKKYEGDALPTKIGAYTDEVIRSIDTNNTKDYFISYQTPTLWIKLATHLFALTTVKLAQGNTFLVCKNVNFLAGKIKLTFIDIFGKVKNGTYNYLLGEDKFARFSVNDGNVIGFLSIKDSQGFVFCLEQKSNQYAYSHEEGKEEIEQLLKLIIFIELGEITIEEIEAGKTNSGTRKENKTKNASKENIKIVDSKWNTITIRNTGFDVRSHFRLQRCGKELQDVKLNWIESFKKEGYTRNATKEQK